MKGQLSNLELALEGKTQEIHSLKEEMGNMQKLQEMNPPAYDKVVKVIGHKKTYSLKKLIFSKKNVALRSPCTLFSSNKKSPESSNTSNLQTEFEELKKDQDDLLELLSDQQLKIGTVLI